MPPLPASSDDVLPSGRVVRWLVLAGVVLFCVGLYFSRGLNVPPLGSSPAETPTTTPAPGAAR